MTDLTAKYPAHEHAPEIERTVGYDEAAEIMGLTKNALYQRVLRNQIPHVRLSPRTVRFRVVDLRDLMEAGYRPSR
jgi:excisionase family DNA binding protein